MTSRLSIRQAVLKDLQDILLVEEEAWPEGLRATEEMFRSRMGVFPEGTLVAIDNDCITGVVVMEKLKFDSSTPVRTWAEVTDNGFIRNSHKPEGNALYGVDLSVSKYAGRDVSKDLLEAVKRLAIRLNLKLVAFGARIPRFHRYVNQMSAEEYIKATRPSGRPLDPEIAFYVQGGAEVVKLLPNYFWDPESLGYGVLMVWKNPNIPHK